MKARVLLAAVVLLASYARAGAEELEVDFENLGYRFRSVTGKDGGTLEPSGGTVHAFLPPGKMGRDSIRYEGKFQLAGDFEVSIGYDIKKLPRPDSPEAQASPYQHSNNIELSWWRPEQIVIVFRNHRIVGEHYGYHVAIGKKKPSGMSKPALGPTGRLGMRRAGAKLTFLHATGNGPLQELGTIDWNTDPVPVPSFGVRPLKTTDGIDVVFSHFHIKADQIVWSKQRPAPPVASRPWHWLLAVPLAVGGGFVAYRVLAAKPGVPSEPEPQQEDAGVEE